MPWHDTLLFGWTQPKLQSIFSFEELLVDGEAKKTASKYIFLGKENQNNVNKKSSELIDLLLTNLINQDRELSLKLLKEIVPEWVQKKNIAN